MQVLAGFTAGLKCIAIIGLLPTYLYRHTAAVGTGRHRFR